MSVSSHLRLTREERRRIIAGDQAPLRRDERPKVDVGAGNVLIWSSVRRSCDKAGNVFQPDAFPLLAIRVARINRNAKGLWLIHFEVSDRRERKRLVRRKPPIYDAELMERDLDRALTPAEIRQARQESFYTSDPRGAVDSLEAVDDGYLEEATREARQIEAVRERQDIGDEIRALEDLPPEQRVRALAELAKERGIDIRSDFKALERRLERRLGIAA